MNRLIRELQSRFRRSDTRREYILLGSSAIVILLLLGLLLGGGNGESASAGPIAQDVMDSSPDDQEPSLAIIRETDAAVDVDTTTLQPPRDANATASAELPLLPILPAATNGPVHIALIIDDLGNNTASGQRAIALPADITFAILPHTPHGRILAEQAHAAGKEVMLHAPMSNMGDLPLGPGGLTPELDQSEFEQTLDDSLLDVPHVVGVNNHTGSRLTALSEPMQWLMEMLNERELYFVDSVTTAKSVAGDLADENGVPNLRRQVFLDHEVDPVAIDREFRRLLDIAIRDGQAVGIGHPYPETLAYLERVLPLLPALDIHLVFVSSLL